MDLELRHLRALVAVVDEGTFTDAAVALGVSQASVSRSVAALEAALGVRLLQRTTREVSLTVAGASAIEHARRALAEVAALGRAVDTLAGEIRVGYSWAALGRHTTAVQRRWASEHPGSSLLFVQSPSRNAGLSDGVADIAVVRRPLDDRRFRTAVVGTEPRYAVVAADDPLARRRSVALRDFAGRTIGIDSVTGTTTPELWPDGDGPAATREIHGVDEWLTLIAAGQAVGMTSEATVRQHPRPGVAYRRVRDAPPVQVQLAWWKDDPPRHVTALVRLITEEYAAR
ncbi:MAG: LysR family transcriptional regulator [Candidatus Nanopelagicales bacterium]